MISSFPEFLLALFVDNYKQIAFIITITLEGIMLC